MKQCCKTCPFKRNKDGHWQHSKLASEVLSRTLFQAQQICHGTEGNHREPKNRCKGAYDEAFTLYQRLGWEPEKHLKSLASPIHFCYDSDTQIGETQ